MNNDLKEQFKKMDDAKMCNKQFLEQILESIL